MWEDINGLYYTVSQFCAGGGDRGGAAPFLRPDQIRRPPVSRRHDATLPHDEGWEFLRIGWSLERAEMTARLVDVQYHNLLDGPPAADALDNHQWMAVLRSVGAYEAYHRQYHPPLEPEKVAEMLILDHQHPRSIRFNVAEFQAGLRAVSGSGRGSYANEAERLAGKLVERLSYDKIGEIFTQGLHGYLNDLVRHVRRNRGRYRANLFLLRGGGMNRYHLVHITEFLYDGPVSESYNEVRLRPIHDEKQSCLSFRLMTAPGSRGTSYRDAYGNWVHQFNVLPEHRRLKVEAESVVLAHDTSARRPIRRRLRISTRASISSTRSISISSRRRRTCRT